MVIDNRDGTIRVRGTPVELSENARVVLERRYLGKDDAGAVIETPEQLFTRVAENLAEAELRHGGTQADAGALADRFYDVMTTFRFLPNSPTLGNAGRPLQQLSACFVLPVEDSMERIFETIKNTALIHQSGGGTGFAFSRLRPTGDRVKSTSGVASGPVSFMRVFDAATEAIKQGGTRRGANMAILSVDHPDIEAFVDLKNDMTTLTNFNISVAVTEAFMEAVDRNGDYPLVNPRTGEVVRSINARTLFQKMVANAWRNGDPGMVFIDRINATNSNATPHLGLVESTNPCGEQPLLPYESCNLGSINLAKFVIVERNSEQRIDWDGLASIIPDCVRFLDNVIEMNRYAIPEIERMTHSTRRIGLGVMGWADMLFKLGIPYDSDQAIELAERVMAFIEEHANKASTALAAERGVFPEWERSIYGPNGRADVRNTPYRNSTRTTIAPTGTLSIIADCSGGIEPAFALAFMRQHYLDPNDPSKMTQLAEVNGEFAEVARREGFYSKELIEDLARGGSIQGDPRVPAKWQRVFVTAHDTTPEWHVRMQAAFQRHTDNAVSKTINFSHAATIADVEMAYSLAYREGCKGITIYRDGSRDMQVLGHFGAADGEAHDEPAATPAAPAAIEAPAPYRRRLPDLRQSLTHKFAVGEQEGYLTVGLHEDGSPGEIFVKISKEGSTVSGLMDAVATLTSVALQYGVPLDSIANKLKNSRFEPAGRTMSKDIPHATSVLDYIFRWLQLQFGDAAAARGVNGGAGGAAAGHGAAKRAAMPVEVVYEGDGPLNSGLGCPDCGSILFFQEGCLTCHSCGYNKCG